LGFLGLQQKYLAHLAAADEEEEEAEESDFDYDDRGREEAYQELLDAINEAREQGSRLDDQIITRLFRDRLHSKPCQNQGFVLDGYPKTIDQAKELFSGTDTCTLEHTRTHASTSYSSGNYWG